MITWLPYPDFWESAKVLDQARLQKQNVECLQIYNILMAKAKWVNHPAVRMWVNYPKAFVEYWSAIATECHKRGIQFNFNPPVSRFMALANKTPSWLGRVDLHASHRGQLIRKFPGWYLRLGWKDKEGAPLVWPE